MKMAIYEVEVRHPKMRDREVAGKAREQLINELKGELVIKGDSLFFNDGFGFDVNNPNDINQKALEIKIKDILSMDFRKLRIKISYHFNKN